eukprot:1149525-Pelagomonas_calceolata.AAC.2
MTRRLCLCLAPPFNRLAHLMRVVLECGAYLIRACSLSPMIWRLCLCSASPFHCLKPAGQACDRLLPKEFSSSSASCHAVHIQQWSGLIPSKLVGGAFGGRVVKLWACQRNNQQCENFDDAGYNCVALALVVSSTSRRYCMCGLMPLSPEDTGP